MTLQYHKNQNKKHFVTVDEVITETKFVDKLQKLVDYANANVLNSFRLKLELQEEEYP